MRSGKQVKGFAAAWLLHAVRAAAGVMLGGGGLERREARTGQGASIKARRCWGSSMRLNGVGGSREQANVWVAKTLG